MRGPGVVDAYRANPEATAASFRDGWFRTGDSGVLSADGYLSLSGRLKELINRGGEKISPHEVEDALLGHPDVVEAVAFARAGRQVRRDRGRGRRGALRRSARTRCARTATGGWPPSRCPCASTSSTRSPRARRARCSAACWPSSCREGRDPRRRCDRRVRRRGARARRRRRGADRTWRAPRGAARERRDGAQPARRLPRAPARDRRSRRGRARRRRLPRPQGLLLREQRAAPGAAPA